MKQQLSNYLKVNNHNYSTFAKEFGFSPQNIQQWATGSNSPSMKNYLKLIKIIG
jgi:DNA-binding transcriptional regulator YiaG